MVYLKDSILPDDEKIWKLIKDEIDHFIIGKDVTTKKLLLYYNIGDNKVS